MSSKPNIVYVEKIVPDAYHGTKLESAHKIVSDKKFVPSRNKEHYLGDGVYFFESSKWYAESWCRRRFQDSKYGIICAVINLGRCLDLHNQKYKLLLQKVAMNLKLRGVKDITDSLVINYLATNIEEFDTVRFTYARISEKYGTIFEGSRVLDYSQLIICVRNLKAVIDIKLVDWED